MSTTVSTANRPGVAAVPSALSECLAVTPGRFAASHWNRLPLLVRSAERGGTSFDHLLSAADADSLVGPRGLRTPFFTMVADGRGVARAAITRRGRAGNVELSDLPDSDGIATAYGEGATLVLQALHRVWPPLADFCARLADELGHQTQVNVYITPPGAQGFAPHHDTHDVIVMQVDGAKDWTIHPPAIELPLASQTSADLGRDGSPDLVGGRPPHLQVTLEPGDALYLPRGWLHSARTTDTRSIHLTVGLLATTWTDVLTDLLRSAGHTDLTLRHALALPGFEGVGNDVSPAQFRDAAVQWLSQVDDEELAAVVARRRRQAVPAEPIAPLAQDHASRTLASGDEVRPRRGLGTSLSVDGERAVLRVSGPRTASVSFPLWTSAALSLAIAQPTSARQLAGAGLGVDEADALVLLRRLLREHVVVTADGPSDAASGTAASVDAPTGRR